MTVPESDLSPVPVTGQAKKVSVEIHTDMSGDDTPAFELRLLGMRHDEAIRALERQLDLASMKGLKEFSVVHGKGHGVLQEAVHEVLGHYAAVTEFHFARPEDGGTGKTIVTLG
jgi:DNA mismatch repair protein MutS2